MHKFNFLFRSGGAWEQSYYDTVRWSLQVSHGVLDSTFYHSIPSHVKTLHDTLDKYEVTNPYGLFRRYLFVLISRRLLVSNPEDLGLRIWVWGSGFTTVRLCMYMYVPYFFNQMLQLIFYHCSLLCGYYLRVAFISLESLQTSTPAG